MDTDGTDENGTTIRAEADDPGGVMLYIPHTGYLDTQAGALQLGIDLEQVPELVGALLPFMARTFTVAGTAPGRGTLLWVDPAAGPDGCIVLRKPTQDGAPQDNAPQGDAPLPEPEHSVWDHGDHWYWRCMGIRHCTGLRVDGPHPGKDAAEASYAEHAARDHGATATEAQLHAGMRHPGWEYATTRGPRKQLWDYLSEPPEGDGWELNKDAGRGGWEREDHHEEAYWKRPVPAAEDIEQPEGPEERKAAFLARADALVQHVSAAVGRDLTLGETGWLAALLLTDARTDTPQGS